jgi:hypothetical protein
LRICRSKKVIFPSEGDPGTKDFLIPAPGGRTKMEPAVFDPEVRVRHGV